MKSGFWSNAELPRVLCRRSVLMAKSVQRTMKMSRVKTWNDNPATMMLSPLTGDLCW